MNELSRRTPAEHEQIEVRIAPPSARILAYLLNVLFNILAMLPMFFAAIYQMRANAALFQNLDFNNHEQVFSAFATIYSSEVFLAGLAIYIAYGIWQIIMMGKHGQSLGKRLLKIKVIRPDGNKAGFLRTVVLREIVFSIAAGILMALLAAIIEALAGPGKTALALAQSVDILPALICLIMLFLNKNHDRRTLQDYVADTVVIKLPG